MCQAAILYRDETQVLVTVFDHLGLWQTLYSRFWLTSWRHHNDWVRSRLSVRCRNTWWGLNQWWEEHTWVKLHLYQEAWWNKQWEKKKLEY